MSKSSKFFLVLIQVSLIIVVPPLLVAPNRFYLSLVPLDPVFNASAINLLTLICSIKVLQSLASHPQKRPSIYILPIVLTIYAIFLAIVILGHLQYSAKVLLLGFLLMPTLLAVFYIFDRRDRKLRLFCVPSGEVGLLKNTHLIKFKPLHRPALPSTSFNGVVVDFRDETLSAEWERFLSECALKKIQIYNYLQLKETLTGQVNVNRLAENNFGDLEPSEFVIFIKRFIDLVFLIVVAPVMVPLMILIAMWIMMDSDGGPFYIQERMGLGGKYFRLVKFRSMAIDHDGSHFTEKGESHRITRAGKYIRKYRVDELPQFWNVLKGEMSLIGPRPESAKLAEWYQKEVPFFMYRHVVRPGISGWAQVMHGYAAGVDDVKDKLAYDLYYIKHFSLWLDLLIWYKTIKTVVTGFGSR
jgi:lipopolysaccharide/colanic/teichoic acid biosynthesis glycosyltransferase